MISNTSVLPCHKDVLGVSEIVLFKYTKNSNLIQFSFVLVTSEVFFSTVAEKSLVYLRKNTFIFP